MIRFKLGVAGAFAIVVAIASAMQPAPHHINDQCQRIGQLGTDAFDTPTVCKLSNQGLRWESIQR